ncbi:MAG TPA: DUF4153 domain-containing protein, partial [Candidatus Gracilibacteria bacterium]|nr:DUF4153 domain-containing protein [Candidatus Gracilibacteria bacterium]
WHLLALLSIIVFPFLIGKKNETGFWDFGREIISNIIISLCFSLILMGGLSLAYFSIEKLFSIDFSDKIYSNTAIILFQIIAPLSFLARIPKDLKDQVSIVYTKVEKWLWLYIALPLLALYAAIILTYIGKILITQVWPEGTVSYLIFAFMSGSILVNTGISPLYWKDNSTNITWISRILWILNIIFAPVLFLALNMRLQEYGLTETRYFGFLAGAWVVLISILNLWKSKLNLKWSIFSLWSLLFLSIIGPWSADHLSFNNQLSHFTKTLNEHHLLVNNKIIPSTKELDFDIRKKISGHLDYLLQKPDFKKLDQLFGIDLNDMIQQEKAKPHHEKNPDNCYDDTCFVMRELLNLKFVNRWEREEDKNDYHYYNFSRPDNQVYTRPDFLNWTKISVSDYEYDKGIASNTWKYQENTYEIKILSKNKLVINKNTELSAEFDLKEIMSQIKANPDNSETLTLKNENFQIDILRFSFDEEKKIIKNPSLDLMIWF